MILEDFIMLGTTVPEPSKKDSRTFVCSAGVSFERRSLVRIYPLATRNIPRRWHKYRVRVELNNRDSRPESYKIAGDRSDEAHEDINSRFELIGKVNDSEKDMVCDKFVVSSIKEANDKRLSLAIIKPKYPPTIDFCHNESSPFSPQMKLFDTGDQIKSGSKRFAFIPKIQFSDDVGDHNLSLRDWGVYEFMRKHGDYRRYEIGNVLKLSESPYMLIGNQNVYRNSWLVISVFSPRVGEQRSLFD